MCNSPSYFNTKFTNTKYKRRNVTNMVVCLYNSGAFNPL